MNFFGRGSSGADSAHPAPQSAPNRPPYFRSDSLPRDGQANVGSPLSARRPIPLSVDSPSLNTGGAGYAQNAQFAEPRRVSNFGSPLAGGAAVGGNGGAAAANGRQMAPNFLFGNRESMKRRSFALPGTGSPAVPASPGILRSRENNIASPSTKNVCWSPALVEERVISPVRNRGGAAADDSNNTAAAAHPFNASYSTTVESGPPLKSLRNATEPALKQPRMASDQDSTTNGSFDAPAPNGSTDAGSVESEADYWVTVFGFPQEKLDFILDLFGRHGNIVTHQAPPRGNWVHLRYSSPVHVQQALARHRQVVDGELMLCVVPSVELEIFREENANISTLPTSRRSTNGPSTRAESSRGTPRAIASVRRTESLNLARRVSSPGRAGMRSLRAADNNISLDSVSANDSSFLGKVWDFVTSHP